MTAAVMCLAVFVGTLHMLGAAVLQPAAGGNAAGGIHVYGYHCRRFAAQARLLLLLDRGEVGVHIDEQPIDQFAIWSYRGHAI